MMIVLAWRGIGVEGSRFTRRREQMHPSNKADRGRRCPVLRWPESAY